MGQAAEDGLLRAGNRLPAIAELEILSEAEAVGAGGIPWPSATATVMAPAFQRNSLVQYIVLIAVIGILLLQGTGAIPVDSVGGSLVIAAGVLAGALAIAIQEAWTRKRGVLGWIVNIFVACIGAILVAPLAGGVMVALLLPFMDGSSSLAAAGGPRLSVALAGQMTITLLGAWGALRLVNRWR